MRSSFFTHHRQKYHGLYIASGHLPKKSHVANLHPIVNKRGPFKLSENQLKLDASYMIHDPRNIDPLKYTTAVNMAKDKIWHGGIQNYILYLVVIIAQSIIAWEDIV